MKAAVVHSFDQPLSLEDVPIPEPGAEQVLVRVEACGLCHTDIHAARGSIVGTHHDLEEVFELHRRGRTHVERVECDLDDVNDAIAQVLDGSAPATRMVFRMTNVPVSVGERQNALTSA